MKEEDWFEWEICDLTNTLKTYLVQSLIVSTKWLHLAFKHCSYKKGQKGITSGLDLMLSTQDGSFFFSEPGARK